MNFRISKLEGTVTLSGVEVSVIANDDLYKSNPVDGPALKLTQGHCGSGIYQSLWTFDIAHIYVYG